MHGQKLAGHGADEVGQAEPDGLLPQSERSLPRKIRQAGIYGVHGNRRATGPLKPCATTRASCVRWKIPSKVPTTTIQSLIFELPPSESSLNACFVPALTCM